MRTWILRIVGKLLSRIYHWSWQTRYKAEGFKYVQEDGPKVGIRVVGYNHLIWVDEGDAGRSYDLRNPLTIQFLGPKGVLNVEWRPS